MIRIHCFQQLQNIYDISLYFYVTSRPYTHSYPRQANFLRMKSNLIRELNFSVEKKRATAERIRNKL